MAAPIPTLPDVPSTDLRRAMGRFATGVTVITARGEGDRPAGTTVSAVTSLSLDPPLVLVCLDRRSQTLAAVRDHGAFAVSVLGAQHEDVSNAFARSGNHAAWDEVSHRAGATGSPLLDDAHVALDCRVERIADGGDHEIVIGRVLELHHPEGGDGAPLLYYGGRYVEIADPAARERAAREAAEAQERARAEREAVECELPTTHGPFRLLGHERTSSDLTAALVLGDPSTHPAPVVHAHEACLLGDALGSLACDCRAQLEAAQDAILEAGAGVLLYTKRFSDDAFLCAAGAGPDIAVGAGLLARLGVRRAIVTDAAAPASRALVVAADLTLLAPTASGSPAASPTAQARRAA
ncbi:MAG: flavin reductase [Patulibacter minatonensis]